MNIVKIKAGFSLPALSVLSFSAHGHTGMGSIQSFAEGFSHPFSGIDHLLVMSAIGLWAVLLGGRRPWLLPLAFLLAMAGGALLDWAGVAVDNAEIWVAFSVLMLGFLLRFGRRFTRGTAIALVAAFGLGHGYVHGADMGIDANAARYALGFLTATLTLHAFGMMAGLFGPLVLKKLGTVMALLCTLTGVLLLAGA
ncbi:MAG: hypothetical protein CVV13_06865 [Gammaproteobacteria bacterium HGW-Gammaproteobacteria-3]|nr:MAG: hypothetical protein CVV13_06865 [Gammaproteobacteria bacterium HGW-Gammaproteobacteria-3]